MPKRRGRRWVPVLTALGCAVLTAVCTVGAVGQASVDTSSVPVYSLPPAPRPPEPLALPAQPRVLLVGDSYSEGYGAEPVSEGFAFRVAGPLGWSLTRDGIGSTGYLNPGPRHQGTFRERLLRHPAGAYDLVVLQGGSNDEERSSAEIKEAVAETVRVVHERYPQAQLLLMGPVSPYGSPPPERAKVNLALVEYSHDTSVLYLNTMAESWFLDGEDATLLNPANGHPNNAGYARIAERFVTDVRALSSARAQA